MMTVERLAEQLELFTYEILPKSQTALESFKIAIQKAKYEENKQQMAKKRYYLHRMLKDKYPIDADKRTIWVTYNSFNEIPVGDRYHINELLKLGYNVQMQLL